MKEGSLQEGHLTCTARSTTRAKQGLVLLLAVAVALACPGSSHGFPEVLEAGRKLHAFQGGGPSFRELTDTSNDPTVGAPLIIADGGLQYLYPQMTLRGYQVAMEGGADFLLCTVAVTSDNQAICRPSFDLGASTNVASNGPNTSFGNSTGYYSFDFTLEEIKKLRARQAIAWGRTRAFDDRFPVATVDEVIAAIFQRAAAMPWTKPVGLALNVEEPLDWKAASSVMSARDKALEILAHQGWNRLESPALLISSSLETLKSAMSEGLNVRRLLRLPEYVGCTPENYTKEFLRPASLEPVAGLATHILLPRASITNVRNVALYNVTVTRAYFDPAPLLAARALNLGVFLYDFANDDPDFLQGVFNIAFNTFLGDPLSMHNNLFFDNATRGFINGLVTSSPVTAATAAACYGEDVDIHPLVGITTERPIIISSGGSQGTMPAQTRLSFLEAIREGADFIDCNVQLSSDDVLFCHSEVKLDQRTNIRNIPELATLRKSYYVDEDPEQDWYAFDLTWAQVRSLRVVQSVASREQTFSNMLGIISLDEFIGIALNASRTVGIFLKLDNPTFLATMLPVKHDMVSLLLTLLRKHKYLNAGNIYTLENIRRPLMIASFDQCGLQALHAASVGSIPLVQKFSGGSWFEPCEKFRGEPAHPASWWATKEGLAYIKTYAVGISPPRALILQTVEKIPFDASAQTSPVSNCTGFLVQDSKNTLIADAKSLGLKVYPKSFSNEYRPGDKNQGAYDYLADPTLELQLYYDQFHVDGVEALFVATAAAFFRSQCRTWSLAKPVTATGVTPPWRFDIWQVKVGALHEDVSPLVSPPAVAVTGKGTGRLSNESRKWVIGVAIAVSVLVSFFLISLLIWRARRSRLKAIHDRQMSMQAHPHLRLFTWAELSAVTNNFGSENRLGAGAFGTVYKGVLSTGMPVAVKRLGVSTCDKKKDALAVRQLQNEVSIIGTVHNRNVVTLQGYSVDKEWLLVYDYMPYGSLQDALWDPKYPVQLNWRQWFRILIGIAKGLRYLHEECEHKIIHRDIKPANILLDSQLNPRVADFGLARNATEGATHDSTKVMGTFGYVAPDYALTGHLTEKSDVYSFGVLMMTIITGRHPIWPDDDCPKDQKEVTIDWVQEKAQEGVEELLTVINPKLKYDRQQAIRWLYVSLVCTQFQPVMRPSMGDVVQMLLGTHQIPEICVHPAKVVFPMYLNLSDTEDDRSGGW